MRTPRPSRKLDNKGHRPYGVKDKIGTYAYLLDLPNTTMKIQNVFHVLLLDPTASDPLQGPIRPPPSAVKFEGEEEWQVLEVLDSKFVRNRVRYLVKWEGYDKRTRKPAELIKQLQAVDEFHKQYSLKPAPLPENPE